MSKQKLINHLKNDIYCRLGVSKIAGIGVFAIRDIPKGVNPYKNLYSHKDKVVELTDGDLKGVDKNVKKVLKDFFGSNKNDTYDVLYNGPNFLNVSFYMNHSDKPNVDIVDTPNSEYLGFKTNCVIKKGEEMTINYNEYD
jgi:SET domain-containing protein